MNVSQAETLQENLIVTEDLKKVPVTNLATLFKSGGISLLGVKETIFIVPRLSLILTQATRWLPSLSLSPVVLDRGKPAVLNTVMMKSSIFLVLRHR